MVFINVLKRLRINVIKLIHGSG